MADYLKKCIQWSGGPYNGSNPLDFSDIRIFSGAYSNVIGGGGANGDGNGGYSGQIKDTYVTLIGTTKVIESVYGGSIKAPVTNTHVLIAGSVTVNSNGYHESNDGRIRGDLSTVVGGSRFGTVDEADQESSGSHVIIAGSAKVFAVQGGGRNASQSHTYYADVTVMGKSNVEIVVGSVTDGNPSSNSNASVGKATVTVRGEAEVGNVYGGGWDIWEVPNGPSTEQTEVIIDGSPTIRGAVYGGGFRGTVGTDQSSGASSEGYTTSIHISGGTIGAVYGGGRGGQDPIYNFNKDYWGNEGGYGPGHKNDSTGSAKVIGNVNITIEGGTITGSVYGGGQGASPADGIPGRTDVAAVEGDITITINNGSVGGSVYGGGHGVADSNKVANVTGDVSVVVSGGKINGFVYGGGEYSLTTSDSVTMVLSGTETVVMGNVYGGGYGVEKRISTDVGERTITINGPTIHGSVFGGSRFGDDNYVDNNNRYRQCVTNIYILSGNISAGSSGNVYGGGYVGRSKMDVGIYVGSAVSPLIGKPMVNEFSIRSIYGGASVGDISEGYQPDTVLLYGNVVIEIGGTGFDGRISGDVFGEGDYCRISGEASILFEDFRQDGSMLSIQKADSVVLEDSELWLQGNVDGNTTAGSAKFSINDVGKLTLDGHSTADSKSGLRLEA